MLGLEIVFSEESFEDLNLIQTYTKLTFGEKQKLIYQEKLESAFIKLSQMPTMGHKHKSLSEELRIYNVEYHSIIYNFTETHLQIIRIVHQRRNIEDLS